MFGVLGGDEWRQVQLRRKLDFAPDFVAHNVEAFERDGEHVWRSVNGQTFRGARLAAALFTLVQRRTLVEHLARRVVAKTVLQRITALQSVSYKNDMRHSQCDTK